MLISMPTSACTDACTWQPYVFLGLHALKITAITMMIPASQQVILRCVFTPLVNFDTHTFGRVVAFHERELALTVMWLFARIFGMIPGPMVFGRIIDSSCSPFRGCA
jgi:hypothetical protein